MTTWFTVVSSSAALFSSVLDLYAKKERSWLDYYHLSMSLFMLVNVVTKPITIKQLFDSTQLQHLKSLKDDLKVTNLFNKYTC
jgi:hypothetical protein